MAISVKNVLERVCAIDDGERNAASDSKSDLKRAFSHANLALCFKKKTGHGIDTASVRETLSPLLERPHLTTQIAEIIHDEHASQNFVDQLIKSKKSALLRVIPILIECPAYEMPGESSCLTIIRDMASTLIELKNHGGDKFRLLVGWWSHDRELFERVVSVFLKAFETQHGSSAYRSITLTDTLVQILTILHQVNESSGLITPNDTFYLKDLESDAVLDMHIDIHIENTFNNMAHTREPCLVDKAFFLPVPAKWKVLCAEVTCKQLYKQDGNMFQNFREQLLRNIFAPVASIPQVPVSARFEIKRNHLVKSAYENVNKALDLTLPLEIHFKDDISLGVNGGGPMKEFFTLLFKRLLDVDKHTLFKDLGDAFSGSVYWFNKEYANEKRLRSVGKLFGLMLYSKVVVSLPFPVLFYKKLLTDSDSCFADLKMLDKDMAESMETLLSMSDEELADSGYTFTVNDSHGKLVDLKPGGADIAVTSQNVKEYLELYAEHHTASSQFRFFKEGFLQIFDPVQLRNLFTPQELRALCVCKGYDWRAFQESFGYDEGYTVDHRVVKMFWEVFHEDLDEDQKRHFLMFFTGSDHVPPGGFPEIGPGMWSLGDSNQSKGADPSDICPEVNTCRGYVVLHLPQYRCKEDLKERLLKAFEQKTGFHKIPTQ